MRKIHHKIRTGILGLVDFFYPMFKKILPLQTYRYAACGGSNTLLSLFIYFISYNFIVTKSMVHLGFATISPHIAALIISSGITLPIGFYLSMYVVFQGSYLRRRIQFFRYFLVVMSCFFMNYVLLKVFVEQLRWYPTIAQFVTISIVVTFSYVAQRFFSFRVGKVGSLQPQCQEI